VVVVTEVPVADIIAPDNEDIGLVLGLKAVVMRNSIGNAETILFLVDYGF